MAKPSFTILIVPDHRSRVRRITLGHKILVRAGMVLGAMALLGAGMFVHYLSVVGRASQAVTLQDENLALKSQLRLVQEKISYISETLERVERFDAKLRVITQLNDPERNLAIGPVNAPPGVREEEPVGGVATMSDEAGLPAGDELALLSAQLENLSTEAESQEASLHDLGSYFEDQKELLASTPSIWPARGWVTSDFGMRLDPYTAERVMHKGLDIASLPGTPVFSPADGVVVFNGTEGGYGKVVVLDHGFGVKTRFAHLMDTYVHIGDSIKRGQKIAAVGNTGRSTGPHVHYEVRVNGLPENPRKFILE